MQRNWQRNLARAGLSLGTKVLLTGLVAASVSVVQVSAQAVPEPSPIKSESSSAPDKEATDAGPKPVAADSSRIYQAVCPGLRDGLFQGKILPPVRDGQCGEQSPLEVTSISTIELSAPVVLNCRMAEALTRWARDVQVQLNLTYQTKITRLNVSTSYQCRRRNNQPTGKISEHGFANAIDITGIILNDSSKYSVGEHWNSGRGDSDETSNSDKELPRPARILKMARDRACAHFSTVLSPESDPNHSDHFHFDLGCHGKNCTYYICE